MLKIVLVLFLSLFANSIHAQTLSSDQIAALKSTIWQSIQNKHPADGTSLFNGSFDWHSDVHAHWALLSIARVTKDAALEKTMMSIFTIERIEHEFEFLMSSERINFEKPYGRAWMLLLMWELDHRSISKDPTFQKIRWVLTQDMLLWLQKSPFPEDTRTNSLIGTHDSWLMSFFLFNIAKDNSTEIERQIEDLIRYKLVPMANQIEKTPMQSYDFLFLPSLQYLIDPEGKYQKSSLPLPDSDFACHYPGAIQVSLWAQAAQCAKGDVNSCRQVKSVSQNFFGRQNLWKQPFDCVSHWVPQFVWMTHWLSLGKP